MKEKNIQLLKESKTNKAEWKESEMEQSKCLLQGPGMTFGGLWTYSRLATCLLQARHNTAGLGLGSKPTAARVYHATVLHHPCINVKKKKKT
jgi:hypothetical protein